MIPIGYMYKTVAPAPDWLEAPQVAEICSVSACISADFADYIPYWKHNGYWLFDEPEIIEILAKSENIDLAGMTLFYYEAFEEEFDEKTGKWAAFAAEPSFETNVKAPAEKRLLGYDVVEFFAGTNPGCSLLSCNAMARELPTNRYCLFDDFAQAKAALEEDRFDHCEPGPYRIIAVYTVGAGHR